MTAALPECKSRLKAIECQGWGAFSPPTTRSLWWSLLAFAMVEGSLDHSQYSFVSTQLSQGQIPTAQVRKLRPGKGSGLIEVMVAEGLEPRGLLHPSLIHTRGAQTGGRARAWVGRADSGARAVWALTNELGSGLRSRIEDWDTGTLTLLLSLPNASPAFLSPADRQCVGDPDRL